MSYEFDEIRFLKEEGADWWQTIKKVPIKIYDQDFGTEVPISELTDSPTEDKPEKTDGQSSEEVKQQVPDSDKVLGLDSFKRKSEVMFNTGYSMVKFEKNYFEAEIHSKQFDSKVFNVRIDKGFLVIFATGQTTEGDGTVWRKFERRYMLPHDCHISNIGRQVTIEYIGGGIRVNVAKHDPEVTRRLMGQHPALKAAGSPPPMSPPRDHQLTPKKSLSPKQRKSTSPKPK